MSDVKIPCLGHCGAVTIHKGGARINPAFMWCPACDEKRAKKSKRPADHYADRERHANSVAADLGVLGDGGWNK